MKQQASFHHKYLFLVCVLKLEIKTLFCLSYFLGSIININQLMSRDRYGRNHRLVDCLWFIHDTRKERLRDTATINLILSALSIKNEAGVEVLLYTSNAEA